MNPEKAEKLFILMKQHGVEHFKHKELEIKMTPGEPLSAQTKSKAKIKEMKGKNPPPPQAIPTVQLDIEHHVNEVANLLRLDDNALVDKLFPDYSQMPANQEGA